MPKGVGLSKSINFFRQRALKALDERLKKSSQHESWPSLDDGSQDETAASPVAMAPAHVQMQLEGVLVEKNTPKPQTEHTSINLEHQQISKTENV